MPVKALKQKNQSTTSIKHCTPVFQGVGAATGGKAATAAVLLLSLAQPVVTSVVIITKGIDGQAGGVRRFALV